MWYNVDFPRLVVLTLPTALRKPVLSALAQILLKPLESLHYNWGQWRDSNIYKLSHTGQICYLRKSLNDKFDPDQRRIYIGDGQVNETLYIFTEGEAQDVYMETEGEGGTLWMRSEVETADTGYDFIVYVPQEIYETQIHGLNAHIKLYKPGGKRYGIITITD